MYMKISAMNFLPFILYLNDVDFMVEIESLAREKKRNAVAVVMKFLLSPEAYHGIEESNLSDSLNGNKI